LSKDTDTTVSQENVNPLAEEENKSIVDSKESNLETEVKKTDETKDENSIVDEEFTSAKESTGGKLDTDTLVQEVAKLEATIETTKGQIPDVKMFYREINKYLSEDDLELQFEDDKTAYFEKVEEAKAKYLKENTKDMSEDEIKLDNARKNLHTAKAIEIVLKDAKYKDFNFQKAFEFYNEELNTKEKRALDEGSTLENLPEYLKKVHDEFLKRNPRKIKQVQGSGIPDTSNTSKTSIDDKSEIKKEAEDKKYKDSIGFKKL